MASASLLPGEAASQRPGGASATAAVFNQTPATPKDTSLFDSTALRECAPADVSKSLRCRLRAEVASARDRFARRTRVNRDWYYTLLVISLVCNALAAIVGQWEIRKADDERALAIQRRQKNAAAALALMAGLLTGVSAARGLERQMRAYGTAGAELGDIERESYEPTSDVQALYQRYLVVHKQASLQSLDPSGR